jgi:hypothetical protein
MWEGLLMSNLGWYQMMTTAAKKVGGPKNLFLIVAGSGAVMYKLGEIGVKQGYKVIKSKITRRNIIDSRCGKEYCVTENGKDENGLTMNIGDRYRVLEIDGDAILIEKIGDAQSPYFVSCTFLRSISDFDHLSGSD